MADVRAMLRAERAARTQPPARKPVKTAAPPTSKNLKRKAADSDNDDAWDTTTTTTTTTTAKRARGSDGGALPEDFFDPGAKPSPESRSIESTQFTSRPASHDAITTTAQPTNPTALPSPAVDAQPPPPGPDATTTVDEDEWAAFEREVAAAPAPQQPSSTLAAINAAATIEAKPMTAEELAAQAKDELNKQRSRREEEMDAEKEDAVRHLEEEFDEMEELEQRVQRLRAQREALRQTREEHAAVAEEAPTKAAEDEEDEDESEDEDDDDFDDWRFRGP